MAEGPRVLVTRPHPGAFQTAAKLRGLGFSALVLPLQETRTVDVDMDAIPADAVGVAVPSGSAIRHAPREMLDRLVDLHCFAVGPASADVARSAGFRDVSSAGGDASSLAAEIIASRPTGTIVYLCGKVRRDIFEDSLKAAFVRVATIETYDTIAIRPDVDTLRTVLGSKPVDHALVYSAAAAEQLAELMQRQEARNLFARTALICMSARIAAKFEECGSSAGNSGGTLVAGEPSEEALLNALRDSVRTVS